MIDERFYTPRAQVSTVQRNIPNCSTSTSSLDRNESNIPHWDRDNCHVTSHAFQIPHPPLWHNQHVPTMYPVPAEEKYAGHGDCQDHDVSSENACIEFDKYTTHSSKLAPITNSVHKSEKRTVSVKQAFSASRIFR